MTLMGGAGPWLALGAPLVALPLFASALATGALATVTSAHSAHVLSLAWAALAWIQPAALLRLQRLAAARRLPGSSALLPLCAALLLCVNVSALLQGPNRPGPLSENETWELLSDLSDAPIILTEPRFAPALSARPELYVTEDWSNRQEVILERVTLAALHPDHAWNQALLTHNFQAIGGNEIIRIWKRNAAPTSPLPLTP